MIQKEMVMFNQTLQNYPKVSIGNDVYNITKNDKIQITDITESKFPNTGANLLQKYNFKCNDKKNGNIHHFARLTKANSATSHSGAKNLPPIGNRFMYIETSSNIHGKNIFASFERIDIIQITNITFYYSRFQILTNNS